MTRILTRPVTRRRLAALLILGAATLGLAGCGKKIGFPDPPDDVDVPYPRGYPDINTDPKPRGDVP